MPAALSACILTEAGPLIGVGHLARCVALYDALEAHGCVCQLVVAGETPEHIVEQRCATVTEWYLPETAAAMLRGVDVAVVDSYVADAATYARVAESVAAAAYIDDTARLAYPSGLVVNSNPDAEALLWPDAMCADPLYGTAYQLLRGEFNSLLDRQTRPLVEHALALPGSASAGPAALAWFETAIKTVFGESVVLGGSVPRRAIEMRDAMLAADVAVSAAGQTLYELAATGTPTVAVVLADNQLAQARALDRSGVVLYAGVWGDPGTPQRIVTLLDKLKDAEARQVLSGTARSAVDGRGAERVARALIERTGRS